MRGIRGITLIALIITIIILLILAGISIAMLTGENGILTKADTAQRETDIQETKEQIKLEIISNVDDRGNYTNEDVIRAVQKVTDKEVEEKAGTVNSKKGNSVDISDLWVQELITFTIQQENSGIGVAQFSVPRNTTWNQFLADYAKYDWSAFDCFEYMRDSGEFFGSWGDDEIYVNTSYLFVYIKKNDDSPVYGSEEIDPAYSYKFYFYYEP